MMLRLCYVDGDWAYFTTRDIDKQWGDDWNDVPYEHNAGTPYPPMSNDKEGEWMIFKVAWDGPFVTPREGHVNSPYSVQMINAGKVPWLKTDQYHDGEHVEIKAGLLLPMFIHDIKKAGGTVYVPEGMVHAGRDD